MLFFYKGSKQIFSHMRNKKTDSTPQASVENGNSIASILRKPAKARKNQKIYNKYPAFIRKRAFISCLLQIQLFFLDLLL